LKKNQDPKTSTYSSVYKNFEAEVIDKYTVKIKLKERMIQPELFFTDYRAGFIIPRKPFEVIERKAYGFHDLRYFSLKIYQAFYKLGEEPRYRINTFKGVV